MTSRRRLRLRIEVVLGIVFALVAIATVMDPQWIEQLLTFDPDSANGGAEWMVAAAFGMGSLAAALLAAGEWRLLAAESAQ